MNEVFRYFNDSDSNDARFLIDIIGPILPFIHHIPSRTVRMYAALKQACGEIAYDLIKNSEKERDGADNVKDRSILGMLGECKRVWPFGLAC